MASSHSALCRVQALVFVKDLDSGILAQCPTAASHFATLRCGLCWIQYITAVPCCLMHASTPGNA